MHVCSLRDISSRVYIIIIVLREIIHADRRPFLFLSLSHKVTKHNEKNEEAAKLLLVSAATDYYLQIARYDCVFFLLRDQQAARV